MQSRSEVLGACIQVSSVFLSMYLPTCLHVMFRHLDFSSSRVLSLNHLPGLLEGDLDSLSVPGGDSSPSSPLPPGLLVGCGGGRRKEGFTPNVRPFLRDFGVKIPRVGAAAELLADNGKELHSLIRKIVDLLLQEMQRE